MLRAFAQGRATRKIALCPNGPNRHKVRSLELLALGDG